VIEEARESNVRQIKVIDDVELVKEDIQSMKDEISDIMNENQWVCEDEEDATERW